jgi:hypothetical protein
MAVRSEETKSAGAPPRGSSVPRALFFVGVFYGVMLILNGVSMRESAALLEYGWQREALCWMNRPCEVVSRSTRAFRFREELRKTVGLWLNTTHAKEGE